MKLVALLLLALTAACSSTEVGRACFIGKGVNPEFNAVSSPALECESRTCLHRAGETDDMCTAGCETDDDCEASAETPCEGGFVCAVATVTGAFCCKKLCICADQIVIGPDNPAVPAACDPDEPANECPNIR
jgi:hypothetical protein